MAVGASSLADRTKTKSTWASFPKGVDWEGAADHCGVGGRDPEVKADRERGSLWQFGCV